MFPFGADSICITCTWLGFGDFLDSIRGGVGVVFCSFRVAAFESSEGPASSVLFSCCLLREVPEEAGEEGCPSCG